MLVPCKLAKVSPEMSSCDLKGLDCGRNTQIPSLFEPPTCALRPNMALTHPVGASNFPAARPLHHNWGNNPALQGGLAFACAPSFSSLLPLLSAVDCKPLRCSWSRPHFPHFRSVRMVYWRALRAWCHEWLTACAMAAERRVLACAFVVCDSKAFKHVLFQVSEMRRYTVT